MTLSFLFRMHPDKEIFTSTIIRFKGIKFKRYQYIFLESKEPEMAKFLKKGVCYMLLPEVSNPNLIN